MSKGKPFSRNADANQSSEETPARSKRPYRTPRLTVYGSLRHLALGVGGGKADGAGAPKSRA